MRITVKAAMSDFREEFLGKIYNGYPKHKKIWKAEEIEKEISSTMYDLAIEYLERTEKNE